MVVKLKVLFYTPLAHPVELAIAQVPYKLAMEISKDINVEIITYNVDFDEKIIVNKFKKEEKFGNLRITRFTPHILNVFGSYQFFSLKMLHHFFKEALKSNLIHIFGSYHHLSLFLFSLISKLTGRPILFSPLAIHEDLKFSTDRKLLFLVKLLYFPLRNVTVLVLTKADIKCLKKFGLRPNKIEIIPHGFNPIPFKKEKKDENLVLSVGRFDWNKGQDLLLLAMRKIVEKNPNVKMIIAGKITKKKFYDRVLQLRNKFGLEKNVEIMPDVTHEELVKLYNKASVFVFPSIVDSYGLVNLEAMSVGLPVIASNVGGVSEVVKQKKTGFLIKAGDYEKIAELILRLLKNKKLREKIGKNAINHVKKFSWKKCVKKTMKVYNQMLHKNPLKD